MTGNRHLPPRHKICQSPGIIPKREKRGQPLAERMRPTTLEDFYGQEHLLAEGKLLQRVIEKDRIPSMIFWGPPGSGKTTLARIIAQKTGCRFDTISAVGSGVKELRELIAKAKEQRDQYARQSIIFIDEIHRLHPAVEEILYSAMEDFRLDIVIGQGPSARSHKLQLKKFTLIGATTRAGRITAPLRGRFGIIHRLDYYDPKDLKQIIKRSASS